MPWRPGPRSSSSAPCRTSTILRGHPEGIATLAGLPGVSVVSASYGISSTTDGQEIAASRAGTARSSSRPCRPSQRELLRGVGRYGATTGDIPVRLAQGRLGRRHEPALDGIEYSSETAGQRRSDGSGGGYSQAFPMPSYQQNDGFSGNNGSAPSRRRRRRRPQHRRGRVRPLRFRHGDPLGSDRRHQRRDATVGRHGRIADQGRVLAGGKPLAERILTDLYNLRRSPLATSTTSPRATTATPPAPATTWSPESDARGQPPHPRPVGLRPGQQGAIATQPPPSVVTGAVSASSPRPRIPSAPRSELHRQRDPLAAQRAGRRQLHAGHRPGHQRPGGIRGPVAQPVPAAPTTSSRWR